MLLLILTYYNKEINEFYNVYDMVFVSDTEKQILIIVISYTKKEILYTLEASLAQIYLFNCF